MNEHPELLRELRDQFAGQAMQMLIHDALKVARELPTDIIAKNAYAMADAMMKERTK